MNWFYSLDTKWKIIVIIAIIILIWYLKNKYWYKITNLFQPKEINPSTVVLADGTVVTVNNAGDLPQSVRTNLQSLAESIKSDIYGLNFTHEMELYKRASSLSDVEINFMANYYKRNLTNGVSLYEDMENEAVSCFIQDCSGWESLISKLEKTGNR